jgi:hypothetical protein
MYFKNTNSGKYSCFGRVNLQFALPSKVQDNGTIGIII